MERSQTPNHYLYAMRKHSLHSGVLACLAAIASISIGPSQAADGEFSSNVTAPAWLTATNWVSSIVPGSGSIVGNTDLATFGANPTGGSTIGINMNDVALNGNYYLGAIGVTSARVATQNLNIRNSSTTVAGVLTLNGRTLSGFDNVILSNNGSSLLQINNGTAQPMNLALGNATNNVILTLSAANIAIASSITGAGRNLTFTGGGAGTLTLSGANTYSGTTTIGDATHAKTLILSGAGTATSEFIINNSASVLNFSPIADVTLTYDGPISGAGTLAKSGVGTLVLGGNNSGYSSPVALNVGTLRLNHANAIGTGNLHITGSGVGTLLGLAVGDFTRAYGTGINQFQASGSGGLGFVAYGANRTVNAGGAGGTLAWAADLGGNNTRLILNDATATGTLTFANGLNLGTSGTRILRVGNGSQAIDAILTGDLIGAGAGLTIEGGGVVRMDGTNTYTGATTLTNGTLIIHTSGALSNTSAVTVEAGSSFIYNSSTARTGTITLNGDGATRATLGGVGDINVAVTLNNIGDTLSPGNSVGLQNYGTSQSWESFTYLWEVNNFTGLTAGTAFDQIAITGSLALTGGNGAYVLDINSLIGAAPGDVPNFSEISRTWTILTTTTGLSGFDAAHWELLTDGFTSSPTWTGTFSLTHDASNIYLNYTVIPEPGTWSLLILSALVLFFRRRLATAR